MLTFLEAVGVISSASFGIILARSKRMDAIGIFSVAFVVAFGGGTLRDVLLDRQPLFWIATEQYTWIVFAMALIGSVVCLPSQLERWLNVPDALGLAFFSIAGTEIALEEGHTMFLASLFGVITGTFGGALGDVVCNKVPRLFRPTMHLYATCSFAGAWLFMLLTRLNCERPLAMCLAVTFIVLMRLSALRWNLRLPMAKD